MKRIIAAVFALVLPLIISCQRETPEEEFISPVTGEGSEAGLVSLEFAAALDDASRTWLDGTEVKWLGTDKIAVLDNTAPYVHDFDNTDAEGGASCRFIGEAGDAAAWTVVYPPSAFSYAGFSESKHQFFVDIPSEQEAVPGGFANEAYLTYARTSSKNFTMYPYCSLLKLTLAYDNIKRVEIAGYSTASLTGYLRPLAGRYKIKDVSDPAANLSWVDGREPLCLIPPVGQDHIPAGTYYLTLAPMGKSASGYEPVKHMRITFTRTDNETASRSVTNANGGEGFTFARGKYTNFGTVDEGLSWGYFDIEFGTASESYEGTSHLSWPFLTYRTSDDGDSWTSHDAPADLSSLRSSIAWEFEGKLADSGHPLRFHAVDEGETKEKVRYAVNANAFYLNSHVNSYIEFPALKGRHLLRVEVQYDSTVSATGFPYLKDRPAGDCPHITTTAGADIDYLLSRDERGFHHNYNLFGTEDNTAYQYRIAYDSGTTWSGPRIQRIRLYYSHETRSLELPVPVLQAVSTTLRKYRNILTLTAADAALVGAYDVGVVVRNALKTAEVGAPSGHEYDRVISLTAAPVIDGNTMTYSWSNTLDWDHIRFLGDLGLSEENEIYAYVRKFGDTTDPREMAPGTNDGDWRTSALTYIRRPSYDWSGTDPDLNYLYTDASTVNLTATFTVTADSTQAYDCGFIYKTLAADDDSWIYTKFDQNGSTKATITGYTMANGDSRDLSATLTGLTPGTTYVYKPVAVQHLACKFDDGTSGESAETPTYKYIVKNAADDQVTIAHPIASVYTYGSSWWPDNSTVVVAGSYETCHVASNDRVQYGIQYYLDSDPSDIKTVLVNAPEDAEAFYEVTLTEGVSGSTSRSNGIRYWFFARLKTDSSTPGAVGATEGSSKSSARRSSTFGIDQPLLYSSRIFINANQDYEGYSSALGGYVNPFLPCSTAGYISELEDSIEKTMDQEGKVLLPGGHTMEFLLNSAADKIDAHPSTVDISGAIYNNAGATANGAIRYYSHSTDDYVSFPAISGKRVMRFLSNVITQENTQLADRISSTDRYFFLTSPDNSFISASPAKVSVSWVTRDMSGTDFNAYDNTYNGQSLYLRFAGAAVTAGDWPTTPSQPWGWYFRYIGLDYGN